MHIIDRRGDPGGKSLPNRQRFMRRARSLVRQAVREATARRSIKDITQGGEISVPAGGVHEPTFHRGGGKGKREAVLPGNKTYATGDRIPRPEQGRGAGGPGDSGEAEDPFRFALSDDEFVNIFLEDLELPDLAKRQLAGEDEDRPRRAGYQTSGPPPALSISRTMRNSLSRRIALARPRPEKIEDMVEALRALESGSGSAESIAEARAEIERERRRVARIPFIDPLDLRFRRYETQPKPVATAVMFCLMDVSGSMDEHMKDLAKRFYTLLYLFLTRRYKTVDVVFIRHTHEAKEVDEETFFHSRESGGTVVSTALEEMARIVKARYPVSSWNIYAAQASDGDNMPTDNAKTVDLLTQTILPDCQYYAYLEVDRPSDSDVLDADLRPATGLWTALSHLLDAKTPIAMRRVRERREIYPVFRELFARKTDQAEAR